MSDISPPRSEDPVAGECVLTLEGASFGYGTKPVLANVDLRVEAGQLWFVIGPNGSGKTTMLRALLGLLAPRAGRVWRHPQHASRERLGFVPQRCEISPALPTSVREFVSLGTVGIRRPRRRREADLAWALERAGLAGMARRSYWSLSGGQRQRALVARALVRRPRLLLLDEATEGMDAASEESFLATLGELHHGGEATLLFVTHRLDIAARHATHIALVHGGGLRAGPRDAVLALPEIEEAFGHAASRLFSTASAGRSER
ncbi:MAG: ATP-binding cassette domain-containing protein [Deltaproteobacteria bacterium]|nr:ATP-binding cassette domain-containing protein [Deltaproteobacteria bacterium]MBW2420478.1 ATP-binding cassette domain-containing protein [Deltaproteobacteria bacterium]